VHGEEGYKFFDVHHIDEPAYANGNGNGNGSTPHTEEVGAR
jgi:hypothetical protein